MIQKYQLKFMAFQTHSSSDILTINDASGQGKKEYSRKAKPVDFILSVTDGNLIYLHWKTDAYSPESGFKLFFYCFADHTTQCQFIAK